MQRSLSLVPRLFVMAGLLLQMVGTFPASRPAAQAAPVVTSMTGEASMIGYGTSSPAVEAPEALDDAAGSQPDGPPEPLPMGDALPEPPPPLPPAGPYYQTAQVDPVTNQITTDVGGTIITDTTWTLAGSPYLATSSVTVAADVTLTIEPGVMVNFNQGTSLLVHGQLMAQGGSGARISLQGTTHNAGWWGGLYFEGSGGDPLAGSQLDYVTIADGGYYISRPGNLYTYYAEVSLGHGEVSNGRYSGIYGSTQGVVHVSNTTLSNNGVASGDQDFAIWYTDGSVSPDLAALTLSGNSEDAIAFGQGTLTARTWKSLGYPYIFTGSQTVALGQTLTVEPGVQARFRQGASFVFLGQLIAQGTSGARITFEGTTHEPGWWGGLSFEGSSGDPITGSQLDYVTIADGGYYSSRPGNLYTYFAEVSLDHGEVSNGRYSGIYGSTQGVVHVSNTALSDNGVDSGERDFAIWYTDGSVSPDLAELSMSGNSRDAVAFGAGTLTSRTWRYIAYPYALTGSQLVPYGTVLSVEPGVMVQSDGDHQILISGRMEALGEPGAPITFTATTPAPGAWRGLAFSGLAGQLAIGVFNYTTIEYGGNCGTCANVYTYYARVNIAHAKIRFSSRAGIEASTNSASGMVIENSQITDNATFGVDNGDGQGSILAANNWWGDPSGPATPDNNCNINGTGQPISAGVAFLPFLTDPDEVPDEVADSQVLSLSLNPHRYYAPADGTTRVWFDITLRDGAGLPLMGQIVRLRTDLGTSVDGGTTDASGKTFAYLTSTTPGDATVFAELDEETACEFSRSSSTDITFTEALDNPLTPGALSPYSYVGVEFDPSPVISGVPGVIRLRMHNPNSYPITVDAAFSFAQLGLGLQFGPVGEVTGFVIEPEADGVMELPWVPLVSGHFCIKVDYTWGPVNQVAGVEQGPGSGSLQDNSDARPGPLLRDFDKNAIKKASVATTSLGDITFAAAGLDDIKSVGVPGASAPVNFLQGLMVGNILDFIFEGGGGIDCAMDGGTSCGGWKGPRMHYPGESFGNLGDDPPSQDYETLVPVETLTFPALQPGQDIPAERAAAINELVRAGLDLSSYLTAAAATYDRYAGAVEAEQFGWATQQANAFKYYLTESALRMDEVADKLDALVAVLNAEGLKFLLAEQDFLDYQQRLATEGFNEQEIQAARMAGKTDEGIELSLQRRLALQPEDVVGWFDVRMTEAAKAFRELSFALTFVPIFNSGGGRAGMVASPTQAEEEASLVRIGDPTFNFQVGNPYDVETTIDLRIRRIDLPTDWIVYLSTDAVTLAPGEQITVTATARVGLPGQQGTLPRFAVEGYANGELVGGVEFQVYLPVEQPFYGADRVYLPMLSTD